MKGSRNERGTALVATLGLVMLLLPLGAYLVMQCRTDLLIQRNLRADIEAFYVADAGLEHAVAEIAPGQSFAEILAGPDHVAGTSDDGLFPFVEGPPSDFPAAPFHYTVQVADAGGGTLRIVSQGSGRNGATKVVSARVARSPLVFTPAAVYAAADISRMDLGSGGFVLSGFDHVGGDAAATPTGTAPPLPALSTARADAAAALRSLLTSDAAQRLTGAGGTPSLEIAAPLAIDPARFDARPDRVAFSTITADVPWMLGSPNAPQISVVNGDLDVPSQLTGAGILVVGGALHVSGTLDFSGLVVALGGVIFEPASTVTVSGALWRAAGQDERLQFAGAGAVMYSSSALAALDVAFPGLLPHAATVVGWQEQL